MLCKWQKSMNLSHLYSECANHSEYDCQLFNQLIWNICLSKIVVRMLFRLLSHLWLTYTRTRTWSAYVMVYSHNECCIGSVEYNTMNIALESVQGFYIMIPSCHKCWRNWIKPQHTTYWCYIPIFEALVSSICFEPWRKNHTYFDILWVINIAYASAHHRYITNNWINVCSSGDFCACTWNLEYFHITSGNRNSVNVIRSKFIESIFSIYIDDSWIIKNIDSYQYCYCNHFISSTCMRTDVDFIEDCHHKISFIIGMGDSV